MSEYKSNCCHANMVVIGNATKHYACCKCTKACNPCIPVTLTKRSSIEICQELAELKIKHKELQGKFDQAIIDISIDRSLSAGYCNELERKLAELQAKYEKAISLLKEVADNRTYCFAIDADDLLRELGEENHE